MQYVFKGKVWYDENEQIRDGLRIGDKDVIAEIDFPPGTMVNCGIADARYTGALDIEIGWGYSEWTIMDSDRLQVGPHDLLDIIRRYEGQEITLFISDGPINLLEHR